MPKCQVIFGRAQAWPGKVERSSLRIASSYFQPFTSPPLIATTYQAFLLSYQPHNLDVYILFEHKSYQEPLTAFYLLKYMVKIWELWLGKREELGFPVVIPLVLYHGKTGWKAGLRFRDLFHYPEEIVSVIPDFEYVLWDASRYSDEEIKGNSMLRVGLLLLKYIFREDLRDRFPGILGLLRTLSEKQTGLEYIEAILRYIISAAPKDSIRYEDLKAALDESLPHIGGEIVPTIADSLIEQGVQQGMQQGMQQGIHTGILQKAREAVIEILEVRFEIAPASTVKIINDIDDPSVLKMLLKKAATANSLEEFKGALKRVMS